MEISVTYKWCIPDVGKPYIIGIERIFILSHFGENNRQYFKTQYNPEVPIGKAMEHHIKYLAKAILKEVNK